MLLILVIRLVVMIYIKYPRSLRNVEDLLHERGVDICHKTVWCWWNRFGPMFAAEIRKKARRSDEEPHPLAMAPRRNLRDPKGGVANINGEIHYLWRAVDNEGEVLESS